MLVYKQNKKEYYYILAGKQCYRRFTVFETSEKGRDIFKL